MALLQVGRDGAWICPLTMSGQPDPASAAGGRFQSPATTQGPRTAAIAAASSVKMAAFVSLMPWLSWRYNENTCTPPGTTAPIHEAEILC